MDLETQAEATTLSIPTTTPSTTEMITASTTKITTPSTTATLSAAITASHSQSTESTAALVPIPGAPEPGYPLLCYYSGPVTNGTLQHYFAQQFVDYVNVADWTDGTLPLSFLYNGNDGTIYQFDLRSVPGCSATGHAFHISVPIVHGLYEQCNNYGGGGEITQDCVTVAYQPNVFMETSEG